ncbi:MAG: ThiF family adenylyltransferase [Solirubrobacteraceae bacterium]
MAAGVVNELRIGAGDFARLHGHLFRADEDEHGALLLAGEQPTADGGLLLCVREVHLLGAEEFPPGKHGYRQLAASALARVGNRAADEGLALVSAHSHPISDDRTGLSMDDLAAHERIFGHLLDITAAGSVTGVAFGRRSAAGETWRHDGSRHALDQVRVVGANIDMLRARPARASKETGERFDRQVRLFGSEGQARLGGLHVGVIGVGGGGSILVEQLVHLGVGRLTIVDPDVVKTHNLSRIMGATNADARAATKKIDVAARGARTIDPSVEVVAIDGDIADLHVANTLVGCDFLFLATDTATARLVANAIAQTFLIPLVQIGAKVETRPTGEIEQIYTAVRPVLPRRGCLSCAGLIDPMLLQREAASPDERANQNYLGNVDVIDPSVTTLNAAAAAGALNVFLMSIIGQADDDLAKHRITLTREAATLTTNVDIKDDCRWCGEGSGSRYARADIGLLPCRGTTQSQPV